MLTVRKLEVDNYRRLASLEPRHDEERRRDAPPTTNSDTTAFEASGVSSDAGAGDEGV